MSKLSVGQASVALASGQITSEKLVSDCLEQIRLRESDVRAWAFIDPELALAQARQRDNEDRRSPLHGIPVGVKDIIDTTDMPTAYGNTRYAGHLPSQEADIVTLLKKVGAVIMGKTVTTEFAYFTPGPTCNPNNLAHTPGGSSSGSAAAVADWHVPFALGTQTAGSMIRPASFNGVVGLKPSFGTLPYKGTHTLAGSLDTLGLFSRTIADQRLLLTALAPHLHIANGPSAPVIAVCRTAYWDQVDAEMQKAFEDHVASLCGQGIKCVEYELSPMFTELADAQRLIMAVEAARALHDEYHEHRDSLGSFTIDLIEEGLGVSPEDEAAARNLAAQCRYRLDSIFASHDLIMTPPALGAAPAGIDRTGDPILNRIWTFLGNPVLTYPVARTASNLPLGIQLIAPFGKDHALIDMADRLNTLATGV